MDKAIWIAVKGYYAKVLDMPEAEQDAFLRKLETEEPEAAELLKSLLKEGDTDPALESPAMSKIQESQEAPEMIGQQIGKYKLTYLIGIGGMGRVYLADRMDLEAHQQVAIKIISAGFLTDIYKKRFDRERKILSRLNHPHITRIYDGGISEAGTPYIIMEYVEGKPLLEYVSDNKLSLEKRLELFLDLCSAVDYAHRNFVMHRDLKPGNILVTNYGIVKVIDFGIAKILEDDSDEEDLTIMGYIPLTPAYASPEQLKGQPLTVASDIYSLGVILYELLTGNKPFPGSTRSNIGLTERISHTAAAEKPSTQIDPSITTDLAAWQKSIKGDIDNIVLKALKESLSERYISAAQLADDIRRYQNNYPVLARPDSLGYRFRKYAKRNSALVALGVLLVLILSAGVGATLWQARKAAINRDQAQREAAKAIQITQFITNLFDYTDPDQTVGKVLTSENLLARGTEKLAELDGQPSLQAEMYRIIGDLYRKQNFYEQAEEHLFHSLRLSESVYGPDHLEVAKTKLALAELYAIQNMTEQALAMSLEAAPIFEKTLGQRSYQYVKCLNYEGRAQTQLGDFSKALDILLRAQTLAETWTNPTEEQSVALTSIYNDIAGAYNRGDNYPEYNRWLFKALKEIFRTKGEVNQNVAALYTNIGQSYYMQDQYDSATYFSLKALSIADEVYAGKANNRSQFAHCSLAKTLIATGEHDEALEHANQCYTMAAEINGEVHPATARGLGVLGDVYIAMNDLENADLYRSKSTALYEEFYEGEHPMLAWQYWDEADRHFRRGNLKKAIEFKRKCIDMYLLTMPDAQMDIAEARHILASFLMAADSIDQAPPLLEASLQVYSENLGTEDERTQAVLADLVEAYEALDRGEEALDYRKLLASSR